MNILHTVMNWCSNKYSCVISIVQLVPAIVNANELNGENSMLTTSLKNFRKKMCDLKGNIFLTMKGPSSGNKCDLKQTVDLIELAEVWLVKV